LDYIKPVEIKMPKKDYFAGLALQIAKNEAPSISKKISC
jgi:hypothetical protein